MASLARRRQRDTNIWPGFVDALATLLMVIIFLLMIFVLAQFFLGQALSGRDKALDQLNNQVGELADLLALERQAKSNMRANIAQLSQELQVSVSMRDDLKSTVTQLQFSASQQEKQLQQSQEKNKSDALIIQRQLTYLSDLSQDIAALQALKKDLEAKVTNISALADVQEKSLVAEKQLSKSARAQLALLNQQMAALRQQMETLSATLDASEQKARQQNIQIASLGKRLNAALASKVQELSRYRSEFFGRLRDVLGNRKGIRIVGDRFVFQSEVLFDQGSAIIGDAGKHQLNALAVTLIDISSKIPKDLDWVMRIDGHTDSDPISTALFPSNWELSSARSISVVKQLISQGVPPNRLVAAGFGQFRPLDSRGDEIGKRRNRRIELKLTQR